VNIEESKVSLHPFHALCWLKKGEREERGKKGTPAVFNFRWGEEEGRKLK